MKPFSILLHQMYDILQVYDFKRKGERFFLQKPEGWLILEVQKSRSKSAIPSFTVNISISLNSLVAFLKSDFAQNIMSEKKIDTTLLHWSKRIGYCTPQQKDIWWDISNQENLQAFLAYFSVLSSELIPSIAILVSDEAMKREWIAGKAPGLTDFQRLQYLTVLVAMSGPQEILENLLSQLSEISRNRVTNSMAEIHIETIRAYQNLKAESSNKR